MREIPAGIVDAVITDPPYSSGGMVRGDRTMTTKKKYLQSDSGNLEKLADFTGDNRDQRSFHYWAALWTGAALRIAKPGAVLAVFCDWRQLPVSTDYVQAGSKRSKNSRPQFSAALNQSRRGEYEALYSGAQL
jgi:site-specific DNA-methyltransferase (adenine-specific)